MEDLVQATLAWVTANPYWAWAIIFLTSLLESLAVVGIVVPAVVFMFAAGALITVGAVSFWPMLWAAVAGAIIGDGLSYWLGKRYKEHLRDVWPFTRYPQMLQQGIDFFERWGAASITFGRFFGPARSMVPLVAGMMDMPYWRFVTANVFSAFVWAPAYLLPGMVLGASLELAAEVAFRVVATLLLLLALLWGSIVIGRRTFTLIQGHASEGLARLLRWSDIHPIAAEVAAALADPLHKEAKGLSILAGFLVIATAVLALLFGAMADGRIHRLDYAVLEGLQSLRTPLMDVWMVQVTRFGDDAVVLAVILGVALYLLWRRHTQTLLHWLASAAFCMLAAPLLKWIVQSPRPDLLELPLDSWSFPSGHVLRITVLAGFLGVVATRPLGDRFRGIPFVIVLILVFGMALSRLYLGVHWLSDVIGAMALGAVWVAAVGLAYRRHAFIELSTTEAIGLGFGVWLLVWSGATALDSGADLRLYAPPPRIETLTDERWQTQGWQTLPTRRNDVWDRNDHPLTVQYAGTLEGLGTGLAAAGWEPAPPADWQGWVRMLSSELPLARIPVLPQVHAGRHEAQAWVKAAGDERLVLRLWSTPVRIDPGARPLWIGNVSTQHKARIADWITYAATGREFQTPLALLLADLPKGVPLERKDGVVLIRE